MLYALTEALMYIQNAEGGMNPAKRPSQSGADEVENMCVTILRFVRQEEGNQKASANHMGWVLQRARE